MSSTRQCTRKGLPLLALILLTALPAAAQESTQENRDNNPSSKVSIHGFLTQAYGITSDDQYFGIPNEGSSDLRKAALQVRYDGTSQDAFVVQLAHERWGRSPIAALHQDVELDWAFYQHTFSDSTSVRAGKLTIPFGANNQIRDVGVLLPFYRLPSVYGEGFLTVETVSGASVNRPLVFGGWELDSTLYYGEGGEQVGLANRRLRLEGVRGGQVWLTTPLHGIRVGAGGWRSKSDRAFSTLGPNREEILKARVFSIDGTFGPLRLLGEWETNVFEELRSETWYGQASYAVTDKLKVNAQYQAGRLQNHRFQTPRVRFVDPKFERDLAASVTYAFRPDLMLRLEGHDYNGREIELPGSTTGIAAAAHKIQIYVLSLSTSF